MSVTTPKIAPNECVVPTIFAARTAEPVALAILKRCTQRILDFAGSESGRVFLGGSIERREPDGVNAEVCDRRKAVDDARKVTNSIPISIRKRTRKDLVNDGVTPPVGRGIGQYFRGKHGYNPNEKFTLCNRLRNGRADEDCVCRAGLPGANLEPWPCHW